MSQMLPDAERLAEHARAEPGFAAWQRGYGPVQHSPQTRAVGVAWHLVYLQESGRFREPRDSWEAQAVAPTAMRERLFPTEVRHRVMLTHMRPKVARGHLWPILGDSRNSRVLGYRNRGGTFDEAGMLFANQATWAHVLQAVVELLAIAPQSLLRDEELAALAGSGDPQCLR